MTDAGHLDLDALADHLAGEQDAAVHLSTCAGCRARLAELEAADALVASVLATLPAPALPADVAARLDRLLADEHAPTAGDARPAASVLPLQRRPRRAWVPAAAAGVVLALGGLLGVSLLGEGGERSPLAAGTASDTAAAMPAPASGGFPTVSSGVDYADTSAVAEALPAVLSGTAPEAPLTRAADATGPREAAPPTAESLSVDPLARLRTPEGLADCLAALLPPEDPGLVPLAVDYASYAGEPAVAVLLPDPDPAVVSVFVVGASCTRDADGTLFFTRLERP